MSSIEKIQAREILDSRGRPTIEVRVWTQNFLSEKACVPSGASKGIHEAYELRDGNPARYKGNGVLKACKNVEKISSHLKGMKLDNLEKIDKKMIELDGTENKCNLGANAILGISLACARLQTKVNNQELYSLFNSKNNKLPLPLINILNGGTHASNNLDIQEFMIIPHGFPSFKEALRASAEIFQTLCEYLKKKGHSIALGDEGGVAPNLDSNEEALKCLMMAIEKAGYKPGEQVSLALDVAASSFFKKGCYFFEENKMSDDDLINIYDKWIQNYPLKSIEDGLQEEGWDGWKKWTALQGDKIQIVGDDLFVTHCGRLQKGISQKIANSLLVKVNQVGTITEAYNAVRMAHDSSYSCIISHRSGETEDTSIADLCLAFGCEQIKTGGMSRGERIAKYNRLLEIELKGAYYNPKLL